MRSSSPITSLALLLGATTFLSPPLTFLGLWPHSPRAGPGQSSVVARRAGASSVGTGVFVTVDIKPDRIDDFLKAMEDDVTKSRNTELDPGCLRFDLLRDKDNPNRFVFYECYTDDDAAAHHKTTAHYNSWADFKASGGVESQSVAKVETLSLPEWSFQQSESASGRATGFVALVTVDIKPDRLDDFLVAMEQDVVKSNKLEPGCLRFDLLRHREDPHKFVFFEAYVDDAAAAEHKSTSHYKAWADFKATGGVTNQVVSKLETVTIPGSWAFQA